MHFAYGLNFAEKSDHTPPLTGNLMTGDILEEKKKIP